MSVILRLRNPAIKSYDICITDEESSECISNLTKVIQPVNDRTRPGTLLYLAQSPSFPPREARKIPV